MIIEKHAPLSEMGVSENYCPWINKALKDLMRTRDKIKKSAIKGKSPILKDSYRQIRNKVKPLIFSWRSSIMPMACRDYIKESWKAINELLNKRSKSNSIDSLKETGIENRNKKDISNAMNKFLLLYR